MDKRQNKLNRIKVTSEPYLDIDAVYEGRAEELFAHTQPESVALSFWSPPYFVGKDYEKDETFESWQLTLKSVMYFLLYLPLAGVYWLLLLLLTNVFGILPI